METCPLEYLMPEPNELHYIQHTLNILTEQVAKLASAMERLATIEERSAYLSRSIEDLKDDLKKSDERAEKHREKIEEKVSSVNVNVVKIMSVAGALISILSIKGAAIMSMLFGATP
jgi:lipid II:glycine glycyltransferase (peptidoglycan interpeptide bridge formation enzyme)